MPSNSVSCVSKDSRGVDCESIAVPPYMLAVCVLITCTSGAGCSPAAGALDKAARAASDCQQSTPHHVQPGRRQLTQPLAFDIS